MSVRCSKCGEELLGAVNRCWKCGYTFALRPEADGRPPVRAGVGNESPQPVNLQVLEAQVLEASDEETAMSTAATPGGIAPAAIAPAFTAHAPRSSAAQVRRPSTGELIEARRTAMMAMGGTVGSLLLGLLGALFSLLWPPAAVIAVIGLVMGIWGLSSPRRNLALIGMLICCLAIGIGAFGGARAIVRHIEASKPVEVVP